MDNKRIKNQFYTSKSYINQLQNKSSISRRNDSNDLNSKVITKHISQEDKIEAPTYKEVKAWLTEELKLNQSDLIGVINGIDEIKPKFEQKLLTEEEYHLLTKSDCDRIILNYLIKHIRDENAITELRNQLYNLSIEEANMIKGRILKKNKYYEGSEYISLKERLKDQEIQFRFQNRIYEEQVKLLDDKKKRITELKKEKDELIQNIKEDKTKVIAKKKIHDYLEQKNEEVKELLDDIKVEQNESEECNKRMELVFGLIKDSIENNKDNKALILNHLTENFVNIDGSLLMSYLRDKTSILKEEVMANFWKLKIETNENIKQEDYNIASEEFDYYQAFKDRILEDQSMLKEELLNSNQLDIEIRQLLQTQNEPFKQKYDKEDFNTNLHDSSIPSDIESDYRTLIEMEEGTIQSQNNEDELDKINEQIEDQKERIVQLIHISMKKEEEMKEIKKETNLYLSENKQEIQSKIHNIKKAHEEFDLKLKQFNQLINSNFDEMLELKIESKIQECFNALYPFKNKDNLLLTLLNKKEEIDANTLKQDKITQFETEFYKQIQSYLNKWKETSEEEDINSFKKFIHFVIENDNKRGEKAREEEKEIVSKIKNHLLPIAQEASVNLEVVFDEKKELEEFSG